MTESLADRGGWGTRFVAGLSTALATPFIPLWALVLAGHPRWRKDWKGRVGWEVPAVAPGCLWIHGASVGEINAAESLIRAMPGPILLTADTDSGANAARRVAWNAGPRVAAAIRPIDHPWTLAPIWADARPKAVIFVETTFWPQLASRALRAGVTVFRVSARAGVGTRRASSLGYRWWADGVSFIAAQDDTEAAWFREHTSAEVAVGGDLKEDRTPLEPTLVWTRDRVVAACTRPGDEAAVFTALANWAGSRPQLLLAPRHLDRIPEVETMLGDSGLCWQRRTQLKDSEVPSELDVLLLDRMGDLAREFKGASAAFIGGTFDPTIGGHSPLEAARSGVTVVAGPEIAANRVAFSRLDWIQVEHANGLGQGLVRAMGQTSSPLPCSGSGERTAQLLLDRLGAATAPEASPRPWAKPLAVMWSAAAGVKNTAYDRGVLRPSRVPVPVVSIGSTNSRGSGKTSTTRWFARELTARGYSVGVALRGYRRTNPTRGVMGSWDSTSSRDLGDEGALYARDGVLVAAAPDRVQCALALVEHGVDVVLLDDGLQHRRLARDLDILVLDARFIDARGMFPMGEKREYQQIPTRVDGMVVHHDRLDEWSNVPHAVRAERVPGVWHRGEGHAAAPAEPACVFAGVGRMADFVEGLDVQVYTHRALADHQPIDQRLAGELLKWADGRPLVCTAKDYVRLPSFLAEKVWWRDVILEIANVPEAWLTPELMR